MVALQAQAGNAAVTRLVQRQGEGGSRICSPKLDPRCIDDDLHLQADFWAHQAGVGSRLDRAFHNNRPLLPSDSSEDILLFQQALAQVGALAPAAVQGTWDGRTTKAVYGFQSHNGIPPGGFEAGRKTLLALDAHLSSVAPKQARIPVLEVNPGCGSPSDRKKKELRYHLMVVGDDFTARSPVIITFPDGTEFHASPDDKGHFSREIEPLRLPAGSFTVTAMNPGGQPGAGSIQPEQATATFTVPCSVDPKDPNQLSPELEVTMDQVLLAYETLLLNKSQGLVDLERDLAGDIEQAKNFTFLTLTILQFLAERSIEMVLNVNLGAVLGEVEGLAGQDKPGPGTKILFDEIQNIALDAVKKSIGADDIPLGKNPDERREALRKFIDGQRSGLIQSQLGMQRDFVIRDKPSIRELQDDGAAPGTDPRLRYATGLRDAVAGQARTAQKDQYDASLMQWASAAAQGELGAKKVTGPDGKPQSVTNVSDDSNVNGIFRFKVNAGAPANHDPFLRKVIVSGLTEKARAHLVADDAAVASLLPRRIEVNASNPSASPEASMDEAGSVTVNSTGGAEQAWLQAHGKEASGTATAQAGAEALFVEIDHGPEATLKKVPEGLASDSLF